MLLVQQSQVNVDHLVLVCSFLYFFILLKVGEVTDCGESMELRSHTLKTNHSKGNLAFNYQFYCGPLGPN